MADNFQVPATLPDGDPGVNIHALERTVNAATVKVGVSVTVDPTDPTKRQAVDSTYGAAVDVTRSALPSGAATSAKQDTLIGHVDGLEALLTTIDADTSTLAAVDYATGADVASLGVTGGGVEASALRVTIANDSTGVVSVDDNGGSLTIDGTVTANAGTGTFAVSASSLPLPTGAATAAKQDTAQTSLTSIDGKLPALGQALAAASVPVVLTAAQVSTLTPPAAITGFALESGGNLATLVTEVGATNETAPVSDTATSGLSGRLQRIAQRITSLIAQLPAALGQTTSSASLPVTVASDQTPVPVGNYAVSSTTSFTRPADTTAYAVGDVVCNSTSAPTVLTFTSMARSNGGSGTILGAALILGSNPATKPIYDLFLFNSSPSIDNDNATFTPTDSEMLACVAVIPLGAPVVGDTTGTSTSLYYSWDGAKAYVTSGATSLYGVLVARNAVTPSSADTYNFRLVAARD